MVNMQMSGLSIASKGELEAFVADSNEALKFRLIRCEEDMKDDDRNTLKEFSPEMTHQIYGDQENIFGYRGLRVNLWMSASSLKAFVRIKCDETLSGTKASDVEPDPVIPPLLKILAPNQATENADVFAAVLKDDKELKFVPPGDKVSDFQVQQKTKGGNVHICSYEIYHCDTHTTGFKEYHERLQPWVMFYIDAASFIDVDDDSWRFFLLFERFTSSEGNTRYAIAGYTTVYHYYAYPENMRPRISQMLILPPFQKKGLGSKLLDTVSKFYWGNSKVVDITVEDPSDDFIRLRDYVDTRNALQRLDCFSSLEKVESGFTDFMVKEANEKIKLCKRQTRRVYEIIRLHWIKKHHPLQEDNEAYKKYRVEVKKRLNIPFQKEKHQIKKLQKALNPEEFAVATVNITNREQRLENLHVQYNELFEHYLHILERIAVV